MPSTVTSDVARMSKPYLDMGVLKSSFEVGFCNPAPGASTEAAHQLNIQNYKKI